jgi:hypothetical protein
VEVKQVAYGHYDVTVDGFTVFVDYSGGQYIIDAQDISGRARRADNLLDAIAVATSVIEERNRLDKEARPAESWPGR